MVDKFTLNYVFYDGPIQQFTLTAPGQDVLPWDSEKCTHPEGVKCSGKLGCRVEYYASLVYNTTAQARSARLFDAAGKSAGRWLRKLGYEGVLPILLARVPSPQRRGVDHSHLGLGMGSHWEKMWARHVMSYIESVCRREGKLDPEYRFKVLEDEYLERGIVPGVYGFGVQSKRGNYGRGSSKEVARYHAWNAAGYQGRQSKSRFGRTTMSRRLTMSSGVTLATLRASRYLYMRRKLGLGLPVGTKWTPEYLLKVFLVESKLLQAAPRAP